MQRDARYDVLKGIGIIMMVAFHGFAPLCVRLVGCCFHMAVFFILAGWFFDFKYARDFQNCVGYAKKRIVRLWWPAFLWGTAFILLHDPLADMHILHDLPFFYGEVPDGYVAPHWTIGHMLLKLAMVPFLLGDLTKLAGAFWFLKSLLFASVGYCVLSWLIGKRTKSVLLVQSAIALVLLVVGHVWHTVLFAPIGGCSTLTAYALLHLGVLLKHFDLRIERLNPWLSILAGFACLAALVFLSRFGTVSIALNRFPNIPFLIVCSLCGWYFLMAVSSQIRGNAQRILAYIGAHTMPIILFHFLAFKLVSAIGVFWLGMPVSRIADFSVTFTTGWWWIAYTVIGVGLPLAISSLAMRLAFVRKLADLDFSAKVGK